MFKELINLILEFVRKPMPNRQETHTAPDVNEKAVYVNLKKFIESDFSEEELRREIKRAYKWVDGKGKIGSKYREL